MHSTALTRQINKHTTRTSEKIENRVCEILNGYSAPAFLLCYDIICANATQTRNTACACASFLFGEKPIFYVKNINFQTC